MNQREWFDFMSEKSVVTIQHFKKLHTLYLVYVFSAILKVGFLRCKITFCPT